MARDLRLNVDGDSRGGTRALDEVAAASALAAREADHLGKQFLQAKRDAADLDKQLAVTAVEMRALAREFAKTNDSGIKAQLDAQKKAASELKNLRKDIVGDTEKAAKDAAKFAEQAAKQLASAEESAKKFGGLGGAVEGGLSSPLGLGLAGVAAVPAVAAAGGALAGLAGFGAAGLGAYGAILGDPEKFGAAWSTQTSHLKQQFIDASKPFEGPLLQAIASVGPVVDSWHIDKTLAAASKYVQPIVAGLEGAGTGLFHGFSDLVTKGGPAVTALSAGLKQLGVAGGDALSHIADGAQGGAEALHDVIAGVALLTEGFGYAVQGAEELYGFIQNHPIEAAIGTGGLSIGASIWSSALGNVSDAETGLGHVLPGTTLAIQAQKADMAQLAQQINATAVTANSLAGAMTDKVLGSLLASDHAALSWNESLTSLSQSFKDNGKNIDIHTAKGEQNREAVLAAVAANVQYYDTQIAAGATAEDAAAAYDANTAALVKQLQAAHLTTGQIHDLIGQYEGVPKQINTDIAMNGLKDAINGLSDLIAELNHVNGHNYHATVTTDYIENRQSTYNQQVPKFNATGAIRHAATGFIVGPRDPGTLIGEPQTGGEALIPLKGISRARAGMLAQTAVAGYGLDVVPRGTSRVPPHLFDNGGGSGGPASVTVNFAGITGSVDRVIATWVAQQLRTGAIQLVVAPSGQVRAA